MDMINVQFWYFETYFFRGLNSCSFEHVFIGEMRDDVFIGLHNWIQFYLQEKAGFIDYHGFFRRETVKITSNHKNKCTFISRIYNFSMKSYTQYYFDTNKSHVNRLHSFTYVKSHLALQKRVDPCCR